MDQAQQGQNPFLQVLEQMKAKQQGGGATGMDINADEASQAPVQPEQPGTPQPSITEPGQTGDTTTKPLIMALNALNSFVAGSGDANEIRVVKMAIQLIGKILVRNQAMGMKALDQGKRE